MGPTLICTYFSFESGEDKKISLLIKISLITLYIGIVRYTVTQTFINPL